MLCPVHAMTILCFVQELSTSKSHITPVFNIPMILITDAHDMYHVRTTVMTASCVPLQSCHLTVYLHAMCISQLQNV